MKLKDISAIIGTIAGIISLSGILYVIGFKFGALDTKVTVLWKYYIERLMERSPRESHQNSSNPVVNNPNPKIEIPQNFLNVIQRITRDNINKDVPSIVSLIVQELAVHQRDQMNTFIKDNNLNIAEFINLIANEVRRVKGE